VGRNKNRFPEGNNEGKEKYLLRKWILISGEGLSFWELEETEGSCFDGEF